MREKTMKRAAGLMAAVMLLGLAGCGSQETTESSQAQESDALPVSSEEAAEPKEPVTLEWYYRGNGQQEDTEMVEQRVNELLKTYPGLEHVTINLNCSTSSEYQEHVTLAQSAGQQIDILNSVSLDFYEQVENGSYMPLDDLISV